MIKRNYMQAALIMMLFTVLNSCSKKSSSAGPVDAVPQISINDVSKPEGNSGFTLFTFTITLDKASSKQVSVDCATAEGWAKAGEDFVALSQTVTFAPNEVQKTISVSVVGDDIREGNDDFKVNLSNAVNANIAKPIGIGTIENDDTRIPFTNAGYDAPTSYPGYTLTWADEFNGPSLNTSIWSYENGDGCPNVCGWGNNELEYYRPDNLTFQDGKMIIEARNESYGGKNYTSTKILTRDKKIFRFGRLDVRAKLPKGKGIWPALWLLPQSNVYGPWPKSGELDMMEMIGTEPARTYGTLHFGPGPGSTQLGRNFTLPAGIFNDSFHVFSVEWKQDQIKWLVDNVAYSTYSKTDFGANNYPFNEDFFFIINMAVGGGWPGNPDATTYMPQWLIVDYVRLYQ